MEKEGKDTIVIRAVSGDAEGKKMVEKVMVDSHNPDTLRHVVNKLHKTGCQRRDRHPADGLRHRGHGPHKSGHGGKFTWEGPDDIVDSEIDPAPAAIDPDDPNYVDDAEKGVLESDLVVGEVEVAKVAEAGVARVEFPSPFVS